MNLKYLIPEIIIDYFMWIIRFNLLDISILEVKKKCNYFEKR